jgi:hypothetical protein
MAIYVKVIESSFVKRFGQFILHVLGRMTGNSLLAIARIFLGLDHNFARVDFHGFGGLTASSLCDKYEANIRSFMLDVVISHFGGNDLAHRDSLSVVTDIYDFGVLLTETYDTVSTKIRR